jgi:HK97 family phage portal protein
MLPLTAFTIRDGVRTPIPNPPLLLNPSADASMSDWLYMLMASALLRGNAYGKIVRRDPQMYPLQIELVQPDDVQVTQDREGKVTYRFAGKLVDQADVFHFRAYRFPGAVKGLSPIQYARRAISQDGAVDDFAYGYFRDGLHPSSVYSSELPINEIQATTIKDRIKAAVHGREPLILGAGITRANVAVSPEESQFLLTKKYGVAEISRIFGVPPEMIAAEAGNAMTYANVESRALDFTKYSLQPWLTRIEGALWPLLPGQKHVRFDLGVLLRTDLETRTKAGAIAIASRQQTPDEVRAWPGTDLPALTAEQKKELDMVPLTVTPSGLPKMLPGAKPVGEGESVPAAKPAAPMKGIPA